MLSGILQMALELTHNRLMMPLVFGGFFCFAWRTCGRAGVLARVECARWDVDGTRGVELNLHEPASATRSTGIDNLGSAIEAESMPAVCALPVASLASVHGGVDNFSRESRAAIFISAPPVRTPVRHRLKKLF